MGKWEIFENVEAGKDEADIFAEEYIRARMPLNFRFPLVFGLLGPSAALCLVRAYQEDRFQGAISFACDLGTAESNNGNARHLDLEALSDQVNRVYNRLKIQKQIAARSLATLFLKYEIGGAALDVLNEISEFDGYEPLQAVKASTARNSGLMDESVYGMMNGVLLAFEQLSAGQIKAMEAYLVDRIERLKADEALNDLASIWTKVDRGEDREVFMGEDGKYNSKIIRELYIEPFAKRVAEIK